MTAGVLALGCVGVGYYAYHSAHPSQQTVQVRTATATRTDIAETVAASGSVETATDRALSFSGTGKITRLMVKLGDTIKANQVLAIIDDAAAKSQLTQAQANLLSAQAKLDQLKSGLTPDERAQLALSVEQAHQQVSNATESMVQTKASLHQAQATYDAPVAQAQTSLDNVRATAPGNAVGYEAQVDAARTSLENAKANIDFNTKTYQAQVDSAQAALDNAKTNASFNAKNYQAQVDSAQTSLDNAKANSTLDAKTGQTSTDQASVAADNAKRTAALNAVALQTSLDQANNAVATQQANVGQALTDLGVAQQNYGPAVVAYAAAQTPANKSALDAAQSGVNNALAKVTSQQASLTQAQNQLVNAQNSNASSVERDRQTVANATDAALTNVASSQAATATKDQQAIANAQASLQTALNNQAASLTKDQQSVSSAQGSLQTALNNQAASLTKDQQSVANAQASLQTALNNQSASLLKDQQQIASSEAALATARTNVAGSKLKDSQSVASATNQITSAQMSLKNTVLANKVKLAPAKASDLSLAQGGVQQAQASLTTAQKALDDTVLKAPSAGTVTVSNAHVGDTTGQQPVITLSDTDHLFVKAGYSEANAAKIQVGQPAVLSFDALPDVSLDAIVTAVDATATSVQNVVTYYVHFELGADAITQGVKPGMTAQTEITTKAVTNVISVPSAAVRNRGSNHLVTLLDPTTKVQTPTQVEIGMLGGGNTEIISGVPEGATIVLPQTQAASAGAGAAALRTRTTGLGGGLGGGGFGGGGFGGGGGRG